MKSLSIEELFKVHTELKPDELILDVRTPGEFAEGHVPGARNIPYDQIAPAAQDLKAYKTVYIYCRSGGRAQVACQILETLGVRNLSCVDAGGYPDWVSLNSKPRF